MKKKYILTSALPYANGDLHLGHILEFIQSDIYKNINSLIKKKYVYISGIDAHGTPVMLKALSKKTHAENLITKYFISHKKTLKNFSINLDNYYTTHSYENELLSRKIFKKMYEKNFIFSKNIEQFYDIKNKMFLSERYVKGACGKCKSDNQYSDICDKCNFKNTTKTLINPISVISNTTPKKKIVKQYFFDIEQSKKFIKKWCNKENVLQKSIKNKIKELFKKKLKEWDISRNNPYFGIKIPNESKKYFYVWLDAPIGYISSYINFLIKKNFILKNTNNLNKNNNILECFIGKDIIYFHVLFLPALLNILNINLPKKINTHGFLKINNKKMSKSDKTFIKANDFTFDPEFFKYYIASKLNNNITDINFDINDFIKKINSELISKFFNILHRSSRIINDNFNNLLSTNIDNIKIFNEYLKIKKIIIPLYKKKEYNKIITYIMKYADIINTYIDKEKPWMLIKSKKTYEKAHNVSTTAINLFIILAINIKPIIPKLIKKVEKIIGEKITYSFKKPLTNKKIKKHKHIISKIKE